MNNVDIQSLQASLDEDVKSYRELMSELKATEDKMDSLETLTLRKWKGGNYYSDIPNCSKKECPSKEIAVPAFCKLFSLSSSTSNASFELDKPTQPLHL
jgi:hypothetical protein